MALSLLRLLGYFVMILAIVTVVLVSHPSYSPRTLFEFMFVFPYRFTFIPCAYPTISYALYCLFENTVNRGNLKNFMNIFFERKDVHIVIIMMSSFASVFYCLKRKLPVDLKIIENTNSYFLLLKETISGLLTYMDSVFLMTSFAILITISLRFMNELINIRLTKYSIPVSHLSE